MMSKRLVYGVGSVPLTGLMYCLIYSLLDYLHGMVAIGLELLIWFTW